MQAAPKTSFKSRSPSASRCASSAASERFIAARRPHCLESAVPDDPSLFRTLLHRHLFGKSPAKSSLFRYHPTHLGKENRPSAVFPLIEKPKLAALTTPKRKVPKLPYKVLDAPQLMDDFYLSLLDWSQRDILAVGLGSCVYLWSAVTSSVVLLANIFNRQVTSVAWSRDGTLISVGTDYGNVQVFNAETCAVVREVASHTARVGTMSWSHSLLTTGSKDRSILHCDLRDSSEVAGRLTGHRHEVCGVKWSPDGQQLASGGGDDKVLLWSPYSCNPVARFDQHKSAVKALAWSPHQHGLLASGGGTTDRRIRFWNTLTLTALSEVHTHSQVCALAFSPHSNELVSTHGYSLNEIMLWKYPDMVRFGELTGHTSRVLFLALSPDGQSIVTGAGDETVRFWKVFPAQDDRPKASSIEVGFEELR